MSLVSQIERQRRNLRAAGMKQPLTLSMGRDFYNALCAELDGMGGPLNAGNEWKRSARESTMLLGMHIELDPQVPSKQGIISGKTIDL